MEKYIISDLYTAAFLRARGFECDIVNVGGRRCTFNFDFAAKSAAEEYIRDNSTAKHNVNGISLINEIKQLKSYVNNL